MKHAALLCGISLLLIISAGCSLFKPRTSDGTPPLPRMEREFRAVWVATVSNIDWPSKPGLTVEEQQREAIAILDTAVRLHLNAIVFQVRPHSDAIYQSRLEPWSFYLTGATGKAPEPYYDPLEFWVKEAHDRGLELHAWFNPYRAHLSRAGEITDSSIIRLKPGLAKKLPNGTWWLDPAKLEVQDHSYEVVMDVVRRYDVDGIHFDDYFYPYGDGSFPDDDTWEAYQQSGGSLTREDWRRDAVNAFIERVYKGIKKEKPYVKFGLSPFGIWRPGNPPSIAGFDQYNGLYADARLWLNEGWVDYWSPQLYWPINQAPQSFPVLLGWWTRENTRGRNIWPGMIIGRMNNERGADEISNQIMITRGFVPEGPGHIHFSMKAFMRDSSVLSSSLLDGAYQNQALVPPSPWLDNRPPKAPTGSAALANDTLQIRWTHPDTADVFRWVISLQYARSWKFVAFNRNDRSAVMPMTRTVTERPRGRRRTDSLQVTVEVLTRAGVSAVDRTGNEGETHWLTLPPNQ